MFLLLAAYMLCSALIMDGMNETQLWGMLFFDIIVGIQMVFMAVIFLEDKEE